MDRGIRTVVFVHMALFHHRFQIGRDGFFKYILFCAARRRDDRVAVADRAAHARRARERLRQFVHDHAKLSHRGIFFEYDLTVAVRKDLERVALTDPQRAADLFRDHDAAEVVSTCQGRGKKFFVYKSRIYMRLLYVFVEIWW